MSTEPSHRLALVAKLIGSDALLDPNLPIDQFWLLLEQRNLVRSTGYRQEVCPKRVSAMLYIFIGLQSPALVHDPDRCSLLLSRPILIAILRRRPIPLPSLLGLFLHPPRLVLLDTLFDLGLQFGVI